MSKRVKSKEFIATDSDDSDVEIKKNKKAKTSAKVEVTEEKEKSAATSWELGNRKKINIGEFRGKTFVNIREYYTDKDGEEKPGKKGITLNKSQWQELMKVIQDVDSAFS